MQASQSKNAADLPQSQFSSSLSSALSSKISSSFPSGMHSDSTVTRRIASPLSAPIQAARKYLERQRGDAWQIDASACGDISEDREQGTREQGTREQGSREQDRRLERSLYEGHSIEAGLNYDETLLDGSLRFAGEERAYLADSDGSEAPFPYAGPGPMPSPEVVRGAIFRLARESQLGRDTLAGDKHGGGAGDSESIEHAAPLPFEDVARRLWRTTSAGESAFVKTASLEVPEAATPVKNRTTALDKPSTFVDVTAVRNDTAVLQNNPTVVQRVDWSPAEGKASEGHEAKTVSGPQMPLAGSVCRVEEEPALAHDACNLLSALGLYSDLLGVPGVLPEEHRHYADELKLMARRSQLLIARLLRVAAKREADSPAVQPSVFDERRDLAAQDSAPQSTSLPDLLMRWRSLLSTMAHGRLEVAFGSKASIPVPVGTEAVERIVVNLVRNALAATRAGGAIRISAGVAEEVEIAETDTIDGQQNSPCPGQVMVLTVDDSGCGMTEVQVRRLLGNETEHDAATPSIYEARQETTSDGYGRWPGNDRYVRGTASETEALAAGGSTTRGHDYRQGLGLKIVRELVTASGGALSIQSWPGRGTRIEIRWPVTASSEAGPQVESVLTHRVEATPATASPAIEAKAISGTAAAAVTAIRTAARSASQPSEFAQREVAVGPDGFSETELRAMMLRLHRGASTERGLSDKRLAGRRLFAASPADKRLIDERQADEPVAGQGMGLRAAGAQRAEINDSSTNSSDSSTNNLNVRGAIAC